MKTHRTDADDAWSHYAELARRLAAVRSQESARTAGTRQGAAEMTQHADELEARLRGQAGMLGHLADDLKLRSPRLTPIPLPGQTPLDPAPALSRVAAAIDRSDAEVRQAVTRGRRPELLPRLGEGTRAALVYGVAAVLVLAVQFLSFRHSLRDNANPSFLWVALIIPLIGYAAGFGVLSLGGRARLGTANAGSAAPTSTPRPGLRRKSRTKQPAGPPGPTRARFGFVLCFGVGPVLYVVYLLSHLAASTGHT